MWDGYCTTALKQGAMSIGAHAREVPLAPERQHGKMNPTPLFPIVEPEGHCPDGGEKRKDAAQLPLTLWERFVAVCVEGGK